MTKCVKWTMKHEQNISSAVGQTSKAVANLTTEHPFTVPEGYFDQFPAYMLSLVQEDPSFQVNITKDALFSTPEGFFDEFSTTLIQRIKYEENAQHELEAIAPSILTLKNENPFSVPEGYFNNFETSLPITKSKFVRIFDIQYIVRYAVAACFIGMMFFVYRGTENKNVVSDQPIAVTGKTSEISTEAMNSYLNESDIQIESPENLELASNDANLLVDINKETVRMVLSEVSENDIKQFLEQTGNSENNNIN